MLSLIGLLGGGIARILPEIFNIYREREDRKHEVTMYGLQAASAEKIAQANAAMRAVDVDLSAHAKLYDSPLTKTGIRKADYLNALIRPGTVTALMALYAASKVIAWYIVLGGEYSTMPLFILASATWNAFDEVMLSSAISYYFIGRSIK